jgi:hypothetical protein
MSEQPIGGFGGAITPKEMTVDSRTHPITRYAQSLAVAQDDAVVFLYRNKKCRTAIRRIAFQHEVNASAANNEVQTISISGTPTSGSFKIGILLETTSALPYNCTATSAATILNARTVIDEVSCTGGPLPATPIVVSWKGTQAATAIPLMSSIAASSTLDASAVPTFAETVAGGSFATLYVGIGPLSGGTPTDYDAVGTITVTASATVGTEDEGTLATTLVQTYVPEAKGGAVIEADTDVFLTIDSCKGDRTAQGAVVLDVVQCYTNME